ncbi:hypothetical protein PAMA_014695 [Pampus argenteus]
MYCVVLCSVEKRRQRNMASPAKKMKTEEDKSISGYLHNISPMKVSKKNTRYFHATIQSGREEYHRVVVFSPEKRDHYEQAASVKKPVTLTKAKRSISLADSDGYDILCTSSSNIEVSQPVSFFPRGPPDAGPVTVANVLALGPRQHVAAVRVKILAGGTASRIVELDGGPRELMELRVCDRSGQTKLTLWEEKIAMVQDSKSYHITNLYTRKFDDKTILTSSRHTTITEIEDVGEPDMLEPCVDLPKISGCVIGSETALRYHCGICRGSQSNFNSKNEAHRCNKCNMMQKCTNFRTLYAGKLLLLQNGQELSLTLTNSAVLHFISEHLGGGATDVDAIDCKLIGLGNVELDVGSNNAILRIKVSSDGAACVNSVEESQRQKDTDTAQCMGSDPFEDDDDALRLLDL